MGNDSIFDYSLGTPTLTNWTGIDVATGGSSAPVDAAVSGTDASGFASAGDLLKSIGSTVGSVADFGFNLQRQQLATQSQAQDLQLKSLLANLGFKTAQVQAQSQATIAQAQANKAAQQAVSGTGGGLSLPMLALLGLGLFMVAKK